MENVIKLLELLNAGTPGIANLVLLIKRNNGTIDVVAVLDEADAQFDANQAQIKAWLESKALPSGA